MFFFKKSRVKKARKRRKKLASNLLSKTPTMEGSMERLKMVWERLKGLNIYYILGVGVVLFLSYWIYFAIVSPLWSLYHIDLRPAPGDLKVGNNDEWRADKQLNVLLVGLDQQGDHGFAEALVLMSINPVDKEVGVLNVPGDIAVYVSDRRKAEMVSRLYSLGELDTPSKEVDYLIEGVENLTAVRIDRYMVIDYDGLEKVVDAFGGFSVENRGDIVDAELFSRKGGSFELKKGRSGLNGRDFVNFVRSDCGGREERGPRQNEALTALMKQGGSFTKGIYLDSVIQTLEKELKTDLGRNEFIRLAFFLRSMPLSNFKTGYISREMIESEQASLEGIMWFPNYELFDKEVSRVLSRAELEKEQARIELFNGTSERYLAKQRARWLNNVGADVIRTGNADDIYERTTVYVLHPEDFPRTMDLIKDLFGDVEVKDEEPRFISTGDIIVIVGEDNVEE